MSRNRALILGGGVGGLVAANELKRILGERHRIVLMEKNRGFLFTLSLLWLGAGLARFLSTLGLRLGGRGLGMKVDL